MCISASKVFSDRAGLCDSAFSALTFSPRDKTADTILSWNEPETGIDYALSFQEPDGCTELWEQICSLQGRSNDEPPRDTDTTQGVAGGGPAPENNQATSELLDLPAPELRNLGAIAELLSEVPLVRRARLAELLLARDYIPQLVQLFATVEDLESTDDLLHMFTIFKGVVMLNNTSIYEILLEDDVLMGYATQGLHIRKASRLLQARSASACPRCPLPSFS